MPLTPSPSNVSNQPAENVNIIHQGADSSDSEEQNDQEQNVSGVYTSQDLFSPLEFDDDRVNYEDLNLDESEENVLEETNVIEETNYNQDPSLDDYGEDDVAEITVPEQDTSGSAPEISLTDEDLNYLDDFFDEIGAVGGNVGEEELVSSPSDQEAEDYVREFSPEHVPDRGLEEAEEEDSELIRYLKSFSYIQEGPPKKNDVIYYYDTDAEAFLRVRIVSRSNYRHYYNIQYLEVNRPKGGVCLEPNGFWSRTVPVPLNIVQEHEEVQEEEVLPPVEEERRGRYTPLQRQVSPMLYHHGISVRSDRVCRLPEDQFRNQLSPKTKKRADNLSLAPEQEFMRSAIAKSLAPSRTSAPGSKVIKAVKKVLGKRH